MTGTTSITVEANTPEQVAFKLLRLIADVEGREHYSHGPHPMTREWILKTYEQCLAVTKQRSAEEALESYKPESFAKPGR